VVDLDGEVSDPCDTDCDSEIKITSEENKGKFVTYAADF